MNDKKKYIGIACSIFKKEINTLINEGKLSDNFIFLDSMLHMNPDKLSHTLDNAISKTDENLKKVIIYGECHQYMNETEKKNNIVRTKGLNCVEIILGTEKYHKLRKEGCFFLMPEWAIRWKEIFFNSLGFDETTGKDFMREMHTKLLYIDTGEYEIPYKEINEFKKFSGLECEILKVSLNFLLESITNAINEV